VVWKYKNIVSSKGNWNGRGYGGQKLCFYYPLVQFWFMTGCRPSEAVGLRWRDIASDFSHIVFNGSVQHPGGIETRVESQGLDVADWIAQEKLTLDQVHAAIGEKKALPAPQATTKTNRSRQSEPLDAGKLDEEIDQLLESGLSKSKVRLKLLTLAKDYGCTVADLQKVYELKEQEREQEADKEEVRIDIEELLASKNASVELSELFPSSLAEPIKEVARRKNLKSECYALALIAGISRFIKNGSSTMLVEESNRYRCRTFGYFGGIIAESSQMKTADVGTRA